MASSSKRKRSSSSSGGNGKRSSTGQRSRRGSTTTNNNNTNKNNKSNDNEDSRMTTTSFLPGLVEAIHKLSHANKSRSTSLLHAFVDSRCLLPTNKNNNQQKQQQDVLSTNLHPDANLIILTTHVINRIIQASTISENAARLLARLSHDMAQILLSDRCKLERTANLTLAPHARSILGRAIISIVLGSLISLEVIISNNNNKSTTTSSSSKQGDEDDNHQQQHHGGSVWEALVALETVIHFSKAGTNFLFAKGSNAFPSFTTSHVVNDMSVQGKYCWRTMAQQMVRTFSEQQQKKAGDHDNCGFTLWHDLFPEDGDEEERILNPLFQEMDQHIDDSLSSSSTTTTPPNSKRNKRTKNLTTEPSSTTTTTSSTTITSSGTTSTSHTNVSNLLYSSKYPANNVSIDGRLTIRRWASMVLVWFQGKKKIFNIAIQILQNLNVWETFLLPTPSTATTTTLLPKKRGKKHQQKHQNPKFIYNDNTNNSMNIPPGNVCVVAFVSRLIDLVEASGTICGSRQPIGGMETYICLVLNNNNLKQSFVETTTPLRESESGIKTLATAAVAPIATIASLQQETVGSTSSYQSLSRKENSYNNPISVPARRTRSSLRSALSSSDENTTTSPKKGENHSNFRNSATALMLLLLEAHNKCLLDNYAIPASINWQSFHDDENCYTGEKMTESTLPQFHPFQKNITRVQHILLNGDVTSSSSKSPTENVDESSSIIQYYYPLIHQTICTLARSADTRASESQNDTSRLLALGCSLSFKLGCVEYLYDDQTNGPTKLIVLDAKLISLAVNHLSDRLKGIVASSKDGDGGDYDGKTMKIGDTIDTTSPEANIVDEFCLDSAIIPDFSQLQQVNATTNHDYLGIFAPIPPKSNMEIDLSSLENKLLDVNEPLSHSPSNSKKQQFSPLSNGEVISLYLRNLIELKDDNNIDKLEHSRLKIIAKRLFARLLQMLDICYSALHKEEDTGRFVPRLSSAKCTLAADILDVLRHCILAEPSCISVQSSKIGKEIRLSLQLRSLLRNYGFSSDHVCYFVHLGSKLDENLVQPRLNVACSSSSDSEDDYSKNSSKLSSNSLTVFKKTIHEFDQWERKVWNSHIKLALTVGRGHPTFDSRHILKSPMNSSFLGCNDKRLHICRMISSGVSNSSLDKGRWPLCMSGIHHAMLVSSFTYDSPPSSTEEAAAERYICDAMIGSLRDTLTNFSLLDKTTSKLQSDNLTTLQVSDEYIQLSLIDSRLFLLVLCRLPRKDQLQILSKLIKTINDSFENINKENQRRDYVSQRAEVSGFLARTVTICITAVDMIIAGKTLLELLALQMGPTHYHLPSLIEATVYLDGTKSIEGDWYKRESCFMGVFSDWESSAMFPASVFDFIEPLSADDISRVQSILDNALELGLSAAKVDRCHLLFSAWNASAKIVGWNKRIWNGPSTSKDLNKVSYSRKLQIIREDICSIYGELGKDSSTPDTLLTKLIKRKNSTKRRHSNIILTYLKDALNTSVSFLDDHTKELSKECRCEPSEAKLATYEIITIYISFIVATCTESNSDFLTKNTKLEKCRDESRRKESYLPVNDHYRSGMDEVGNILSDESEESEGEFLNFEDEVEEKRMDCHSRLHDCCKLLGYAPFHPDWLDTDCRLRDGIPIGFGFFCAEKAVSSLTDFGLNAYVHFTRSLEKALHSCIEVKPNSDEVDSHYRSLLSLVIISTHPVNDKNYHRKQSLMKAVAHLNNIDVSTFEFIWRENSKNETSPKEAWSINSAHRIHGKLQDFSAAIESWDVSNGEYRAAGEWELLLSNSLLGAGVDTILEKPSKNTLPGVHLEKPESIKTNTVFEKESMFKKHLTEAKKWIRLVRSCANALVPATALLRFVIKGGKGRKHHPYSKKSGNSLSQSLIIPNSPVHLRSSTYPSVDISKKQLRQTVSRSLGFFIEVSSNSLIELSLRQSCRAAACNLVGESGISELEDLNKLRNSLISLIALSQSSHKSPKLFDQNITNTILEELLSNIETLKESDSKNEPIISEMQKQTKTTRLLSCFGFTSSSHIDTLTDSSVDPKQILLTELPLLWNRLNNEAELLFDWQSPQPNAINKVLTLLSSRKNSLNLSNRCKIANLIKNLINTEEECMNNVESFKNKNIVFKPFVMQFWGNLQPEHLKLLIKRDICSLGSSDGLNEDNISLRLSLSKVLCSILASLVGSLGRLLTDASSETQCCRSVLNILCDSIEEWIENPATDHIVALLCLLATRFNFLNQVGIMLMSSILKEQAKKKNKFHCYLRVLEKFYRFAFNLSFRLREIKIGSKNTILNSSITKPGILSSLKQTKKTRLGGKTKSGAPYFFTKTGQKVLRTCSFVETGGDFAEQHWYNCYTCGLLWDKGCCSLCVQVCHKGHDVGYSRCSSFFCDCGAEVASAGDKNRVVCKCLTPLSTNELSSIYDGGNTNSSSSTEKIPDGQKGTYDYCDETEKVIDTFDDMIVEISAQKLTADSSLSLKQFGEEAKQSAWTEKLFELFNSCFECWSKRKTSQKLLFTLESYPSNESSDIEEDLPHLQDPLIKERSGRVLQLSALTDPSMFPVRAAKATTLNPKLSADATADRLKKSALSKNDIHRNIMVADSRGRLIIAEPCALVYCSALPLVNTRHIDNHLETSLDRSHLCILGSTKVKFNIVGMQISLENDHNLVVWGTSEVSVFILNHSCDKAEARIDLAVELEPHDCETEYLLKCMWLPRSPNTVVVVCGTYIKVFDIRQSSAITGVSENKYSCQSSSCFTLAYEDVVIRGASMVLTKSNSTNQNDNGDSNEDKDISFIVKMVLLFDSGRLHLRDLIIDRNGNLLDQGESYIECGDGTPFPTAGIRRYVGANPGSSLSTSSSFGESSCLHYLQQSGLLLYKCISSCLVAMILDETGKISGSFELLPHVLSSEALGNGSDGYSISAPYTHWTELGIVVRDGSFYYRIVCVGKSTRTNQPKILCIEFNKENVKVGELKWASGTGIGLGLSLNTSFEGIAAFSSPVITDSRDGSFINECSLKENIFVATITSTGSILLFGESLINNKENEDSSCIESSEATSPLKRRRALSDSIVSVSDVASKSRHTAFDRGKAISKKKQPSFPLTIFETLINVSNSSDLIFGGEAAVNDRAAIKKKLSISNTEFIISPNKEGFCLTVSLRDKQSSTEGKIESEKQKKNENDKKDSFEHTAEVCAIVAIRLLVGSTTTDYLPREVAVMGRPVKLAQGVKRWYDIPLTDEEIILGVRSGFVVVLIGPSFDTSNNPIIDAIEVYAQKRQDLPFLPPNPSLIVEENGVQSKGTDKKKKTPANISTEEENCAKNLNISMLNITHLSQILGESINKSQVNHTTLKRLVQVTALDYNGLSEVRENVIALLKEVESDINCRQLLLDEGTLLGIADALKGVQTLLKGSCQQHNTTDVNRKEFIALNHDHKNSLLYHHDILTLLDHCLEASLGICKERPDNYHGSLVKMMSSLTLDLSIALLVKEIFDLCNFKGKNMVRTSSLLIDLTIREMYIDCQYCGNKPPSLRFAGFDLVSDMLSKDYDVVWRCCATIADVLGEANDSMVPNSQPIAYKCDICGTLPITGTRYTLEGDHDKDLCKICFETGSAYAEVNNFDSNIPILFNGIKLGLKDTEMSCSQIQEMKPMSIANAIVEQFAEVQKSSGEPSTTFTEDINVKNEDEDASSLQMALKMSLETPDNDRILANYDEYGKNRFHTVSQNIFNGLLQLATDSLAMEGTISRNQSPLIQLLLKLVLKNSGDSHISRGKAMCEAFCKKLASLANACINNLNTKEPNRKLRNSLVIGLCALGSLITIKDFNFSEFNYNVNEEESVSPEVDNERITSSEQKANFKTDPRFICDTHSVPAVRRRCSHGIHKDRRFYVCGMNRKQRCKYFKWADDNDSNTPQTESNRKGSKPQSSPTESDSLDPQKRKIAQESLIQEMREHMWNIFSCGDSPLQLQLCKLVQIYFKKMEGGAQKVVSFTSQITQEKFVQEKNSPVPSSITNLLQEKSFLLDARDGMLSSRKCFGTVVENNNNYFGDSTIAGSNSSDIFPNIGTGESSVVQAILDLLSLVATNSLRPPTNNLPNWSAEWFPLLCEIISTCTSPHLRTQAKKMLKRLCGSRKATYHKVRDHYVFGFQFRNLMQYCEGPLQAALNIREKARRCGPNWRSSSIQWSNLPSGGLLGVEDLIAEDSLSIESKVKIQKILDDLIEITKSRGNNWRQFMGLSYLSKDQAEDNFSTLLSGGDKDKANASLLGQTSDGIWNRSPICVLLWIGCSLSGSNQEKIFHLMDIALTQTTEENSLLRDTTPSFQGADESCGVTSTDPGTDFESGGGGKIMNKDYDQGITCSQVESPETSLIKSMYGLRLTDIHAFIIQFVLRGKSSGLRSITSKIAQKLVKVSSDIQNIVLKLMVASIREIGPLGCCSIEFLKMIRTFINDPLVIKSTLLGQLSKVVVSCFTAQILSCWNVDPLNIEEDIHNFHEGESGNHCRKGFDITSCVHCHSKHNGSFDSKRAKGSKENPASSSNNKKTNPKSSNENAIKLGKEGKSCKPTNLCGTSWQDEQVRPYSRNRLDNLTINNVSTEFATHYQLKNRMAVSNIHISVTDPRGRFVKTISVYFLPRPVHNVNDLTSIDHMNLWQKCGSLSLARGAARASCKLVVPIVAANLKFEFSDFYERLGGTRSADGSLLLHCPRCTRVVNNAHGVCGHCGEVAFQCRKCRHINYDRLDTFLCVECGYCASGGFTFEVTAGLASNSVAITDERELEKAVQRLRQENKLLCNYRNSLRTTLISTSSSRKKRRRLVESDDLTFLNNFSSTLKSSLLGDFPKSCRTHSEKIDLLLSRRSSGLSASSQSKAETSNRSSATNKARSLLSLARQLRNDSSVISTDSRPGRNDMLVRQALLNAGGTFEFFDEAEGDMFGIVNSNEGNVLQMDVPDPLSRLVANIQARVRGSRSGGSTGRDDTDVIRLKSTSDANVGNDEQSIRTRKNSQLSRTNLDDIEKISRKMREAERETFGLNKRIIAWKRMNKDALASLDSFIPTSTSQFSFAPTSCSTCSGTITFHLLALAMALFRANMKETESALTRDFIKSLFDEPKSISSHLNDLKRLVITTLAIKSERGSRLIFDELKSRLTLQQNVSCAEILGKILEHDFHMAEEYAQLAVEVLNSGYQNSLQYE